MLMNGFQRLLPFLFFPVLIISCNTAYVPAKAQYQDYRITTELPKDSSMLVLLKPYSDSVNSSMNNVVGVAEKSLEKKQPEGTLGNFMADAMYFSAIQKFGVPVDAAFVNYGGIRITQLAQGEVTRGKIFELMPFDNIVVLQKLKGSEFQQFLDLVAERGGWPSAGITMQIKDKKAINVNVGGKPLDPNATYTVVNSDYVANGGDNAEMLKVLPQQNIGYLMRDAIFDYIKSLQSKGKNITANIENRVTNAQ